MMVYQLTKKKKKGNLETLLIVDPESTSSHLDFYDFISGVFSGEDC